jgi:predicted dehydrogenase
MNAVAPVPVGLVGAGPWAELVHAPMLATGPETTLVGIHARRRERARALADRFEGVEVFDSFDALLGACDAIACCVAPDAQVEYAVRAAEAGKALLLEKPLALDVAGAQRIVDAVTANGVVSVVVLTNRFAAPVRDFLRSARSFDADGGRAMFVSSAFLEGPFAQSPWRRAHGARLDVGPHVLDLVDAALGPLVAVQCELDAPARCAQLLCTHEGGVASTVTIDCSTGGESRTEIELFGRAGRLSCDARTADEATTLATLRAEFAACVRDGSPHEIDASRALSIERWLH